MSVVIRKNQITYMMLATLYNNADHQYKQPELFYASSLPSEARPVFDRIYKTLTTKDYIVFNNGKVSWNKTYTIKQLQLQQKDVIAYIDYEKYYIKHDIEQYPMNKDIAILKIDDRKLLKASLVSILKRQKIIIDGVIRLRGNYCFFTPEDRTKCPYDIYISDYSAITASDAFVAVEINPYDTIGKPCGHIYKYKNNIMSTQSNDEFIATKNQLNTGNESAVVLPKSKISMSSMLSRADMTDDNCITIGSTDKAISIQKTNGVYTVKYHIADVAHFTIEGSDVDKLAFARCITHNLKSQHVGVFPREFESRICNLSSSGKKLTICAVMTFDDTGKLINTSIVESIIKNSTFIPSDALSSFMDNYDEEFENKYSEHMDQIYMLNDLSGLMWNHLSEKKQSYINVTSDHKVLKWINTLSLLFNLEISKRIADVKTPVVYKTAGILEFDSFKYALYGSFDIRIFDLINAFKAIQNDNHQDVIGKLINLVPYEQQEKFRKIIAVHLYNQFTDKPDYNWLVDESEYITVTDALNSYYDLYIMRILKRYIRKTIKNESVEDLMRTKMNDMVSHFNHHETKACKTRIESNKFELINDKS